MKIQKIILYLPQKGDNMLKIKETIASIRTFMKGEKRSDSFPPSGYTFNSMSANGLAFGMTTERAMRFSAVYAAIRLRSNTIASLPKTLYSISDNRRETAKDHPVYKLLKNKPNPFQNPFVFWNFINTCVDGWGNSFVLIKREVSATPKALIPIHPTQVMISVQAGKKYYNVYGTKYYDGIYSDEDMMHFYFYSIDGIKGVNPIEYNAGAIASGIGAQEFGNEYFENKGNIRAVIETEERINKDNAKKFLDNFEESKKYGNPLLTHGFKWKNITAQPDSSQMIESKTLSIQDVARIFMVPPHLLGDLSRSTFSNIEHQDIEFVKHYVRPTVKMYEQEIDRKLLFEDERNKIESKFNLDGLLRGDMSARAEYYQKAVLSGWMSRNEVRQMEYFNPIAGLDEMLYPGNENKINDKNEEE